jgi:hypothetical protein
MVGGSAGGSLRRQRANRLTHGEIIMRKIVLSLAIVGLALPFLAASPARAQALRTWVSNAGSDFNNCSRATPCSSFGAAIAQTVAGGEVNCVDPGLFSGGITTVTKSITISCEAGTAHVFRINIAAGPTDVVTLRGLELSVANGIGLYGILIGTAGKVYIEKCTIRNYVQETYSAGIATDGSSTQTVFVFVQDTVISDNSYGVQLASSGGFKVASLKNVVITGSTSDGLLLSSPNVYANVTDSIISGNGGSAVNAAASSTTANIERSAIANNVVAGLNASASGSTIRISDNDIYNNTNGFLIANGATIASDGTNETGSSNGGLQAPNASLTLQ